ncbi:MAG: hypothetical protein IPQ07_36460 [Myxococcales bacterium]|jgi:hypothetical protein|nr:hypothetical protein [Myxococcales bacterium]
MSTSHLHLAKSETRDLAERDYRAMSSWRLGEPTEWKLGNGTFFTAFIVICAALAVIALLTR